MMDVNQVSISSKDAYNTGAEAFIFKWSINDREKWCAANPEVADSFHNGYDAADPNYTDEEEDYGSC